MLKRTVPGSNGLYKVSMFINVYGFRFDGCTIKFTTLTDYFYRL